MSLKDSFCTSPWFHMFITNDGTYRNCKWHLNKTLFNEESDSELNIQRVSPLTFFRKNMSDMRKDMLNGTPIKKCEECYQVDRFDKVSGRQRQLLKAGIRLDEFEKTMASSPMLPMLEYSYRNNGDTDLSPLDWQIDLGNHCNSNCIFCGPSYSSNIATEYKKLGVIDNLPPKSWATESNISKFVEDIDSIEDLTYLHFLGGETLITPGFRIFLEKLIERGLNQGITIGFTTNLTVWREDILELLKQFKRVNLGMSVECLTSLNDYLRFPSKIDVVQNNLEKWITVAEKQGWLKQLRVTPTCLSLPHLLTVYDFAYDRNITVESCNFISEPEFMRMSVLPYELRLPIIRKFKDWINSKPKTINRIVNTRNPDTSRSQITQDLVSYINYLEGEEHDVSSATSLVRHLKLLESSRNNNILDYLPEYEDFLRNIGY